MQLLAVSQRNSPIRGGEIKSTSSTNFKGEAMTTYIFFGEALRMLTNAYLISAVLLIAASGIGLAVIETIEKAGER